MSEIKEKPKVISLSEKNSPVKERRDPKKMQAAKMFENQFVRQMISEMRKTVPKDSLIAESQGERIFKEKLDDEYADTWVENGGIGLANLIYDQLEERYGNKNVGHAKGHPGEIMNIKAATDAAPSRKTSDLFAQRDKDLFLLKKTSTGYHIKSKEPLPEHVDIKAPVEGRVLSAANLGEGKQMLILGNDENINFQFVHTGRNLVQPGDEVKAGQVIAQLPASLKGEGASVLLGLRKKDF